MTSKLLELSNINGETPFSFATYRNEITEMLLPILEYYPERDRGIITDRVTECILTRQRFN